MLALTLGSGLGIKMKALCQVCGIEGFLEKRGNNFRIKHYIGCADGRRKYITHPVSVETPLSMGINGNQNMGIKKLNLDSIMVRGVGFEPTNPYGIAASGLRL
jgi:hypothetical protein